MFRHQPHPVSPATQTPIDPVEGLIYRVAQQQLTFGKNRAAPVTSRPVLPFVRRDNWVAVLPITSKKGSQLYELANSDVRWIRKNNRFTFVFHVYQTVSDDVLGEKLGIISQHARVDIANWLRRKNGY